MSKKIKKTIQQLQTKNKQLEDKLKVHNDTMVVNGLQGALFGSGVPGGGIPGLSNAQEVSQVAPLFNNLRWYFISNFRQPLSQAYVELGLIQTVCDVPVDDAFRGGVEINSKILSADELKQLQDEMERQDDIAKYTQAEKWKRLFGGAGVMILTDQDPSIPLDVTQIDSSTPLEFRAVDMWELYFDLQNTEGYDAAIQEEKYEFFSYYGTKVHKSRVLKLKGLEAPSFLRPRLRGWGFSVVEALVRSINQYLKGTDLIYELLDEAKIDVFGIKNLVNTLINPNGSRQVAERIQLANKQKNFQHALVMDSEDTYVQKQLTFSGLAEVMEQIRYQVASDLRMPVTKVFGISAAGFNSGEDDIEIYNAMIESTIRSKAKPQLLLMIALRCQHLFGYIPEDLSISFKPLRVMSSKEEQECKTQMFTRLQSSLQLGAISLEEFRDSCNKNNLLEIELSNEELPEGSDEIGNVPGNDDAEQDSEAADEDTKSNLSVMPTPPTKQSKKTLSD